MLGHTPLVPALKGEKQADLSSRPFWSTEQAPRQPGLYRKTLSPKGKKKERKNTNMYLIGKLMENHLKY